ncbi:MAG: ABC transporter ATP-binding protein [Verrucomicrobia bacterium]|nr:ABC transporter ATP-binding protein [Verrucomicrobiota bacterium]
MSNITEIPSPARASTESEVLLTLDGVSKSYRLWNRPHERFVYGLWSQVPAYAPIALQKLAVHQKAKLGQEVFALSEVSLTIRRGESVGVIGRNGSGKSTLMQLIAGVLQPSSGRAEIHTERVSALLELGSGFDPNFTGRQNVLLHGSLMGLSERENQARIEEVTDFAEIGEYFDRPVKTYSSGMVVRLAFASSITVHADLLIIDEALAVGDIFFQQKCFHKLRQLAKSGVTFLLVSQDPRSISEFCDVTMILDRGHVVFFGDSNQAIDTYYTLTKSFLRASVLRNVVRGQYLEYVKKSDGETLEISKFMEEIPPSLVGPAENPVATFFRFALLDEDGKPTNFFREGNWLTLIFDVRVLEDIENLSPGVVLRDKRGTFLHSKYEHQTDLRGLRTCQAGDQFRVVYSVRLDIAPGQYTLSLDMVSIPPDIIRDNKMSHMDYENNSRWVCSTGTVVSFTVAFDPERVGAQCPHFGMFDLPTRFS